MDVFVTQWDVSTAPIRDLLVLLFNQCCGIEFVCGVCVTFGVGTGCLEIFDSFIYFLQHFNQT